MATDQDLEALFAQARTLDPVPSDDLVARVLMDAATHRPAFAPSVARPAARKGVGALFAAVFGGGLFGGGAMAGMGTAMLAGLAIGLLQPAPVAAWTTAIFDDQAVSIDLMPAYDVLLDEVSADE